MAPWSACVRASSVPLAAASGRGGTQRCPRPDLSLGSIQTIPPPAFNRLKPRASREVFEVRTHGSTRFGLHPWCRNLSNIKVARTTGIGSGRRLLESWHPEDGVCGVGRGATPSHVVNVRLVKLRVLQPMTRYKGINCFFGVRQSVKLDPPAVPHGRHPVDMCSRNLAIGSTKVHLTHRPGCATPNWSSARPTFWEANMGVQFRPRRQSSPWQTIVLERLVIPM